MQHAAAARTRTYDRQAPPCTKHISGGGGCGAPTAAVDLGDWGGRYRSKLCSSSSEEGLCGGAPLEADA